MSKRSDTTALEVLSGASVFKNTEVPVKTLFEYLKQGKTLVRFLHDFPAVSRRQVLQTLDVAAEQNEAALKSSGKPDLDRLAFEQGVKAVTDFDSLLGDFWPEQESVDDFIAQLRSWREADGAKLKR